MKNYDDNKIILLKAVENMYLRELEVKNKLKYLNLSLKYNRIFICGHLMVKINACLDTLFTQII